MHFASASLGGSDSDSLTRVRRALEYAASAGTRGGREWPREFSPMSGSLPSVRTADPAILDASAGEGGTALDELASRLGGGGEGPTLLASSREVALATDAGPILAEVRTRSLALIHLESRGRAATLVRDGWSLSNLLKGIDDLSRELEEVGRAEWRPAAVWRSSPRRIVLTPYALTGLRDLLYPVLDPDLSPRLDVPICEVRLAEGLSLVDDPAYPGGVRRAFDDEGTPSTPVKVLDHRGARQLLTLAKAQARSARPTGSSVRPTYSSRPLAFPSNLVLTSSGREDPVEPETGAPRLRVLEGAAVGGVEAGRLEVGVTLAVLEGEQETLVGGFKLVSSFREFFSEVRPVGREVVGCYGFYSPELAVPARAVRLE